MQSLATEVCTYEIGPLGGGYIARIRVCDFDNCHDCVTFEIAFSLAQAQVATRLANCPSLDVMSLRLSLYGMLWSIMAYRARKKILRIYSTSSSSRDFHLCRFSQAIHDSSRHIAFLVADALNKDSVNILSVQISQRRKDSTCNVCRLTAKIYV